MVGGLGKLGWGPERLEFVDSQILSNASAPVSGNTSGPAGLVSLLRNLHWGPFFQFDVLYPRWFSSKTAASVPPAIFLRARQPQHSPDP